MGDKSEYNIEVHIDGKKVEEFKTDLESDTVEITIIF